MHPIIQFLLFKLKLKIAWEEVWVILFIKTLFSKVESSSSTSTSPPTTPSNLQNLHSPRGSTTPTSTATGPSVWTYSAPSGLQRWQFPRSCSQSAPCYVTPTLTTPWSRRSRDSTKLTWESTMNVRRSGRRSMRCDNWSEFVNITHYWCYHFLLFIVNLIIINIDTDSTILLFYLNQFREIKDRSKEIEVHCMQ